MLKHERISNHAEVYTPEHIVIKMCSLIPDAEWSNPNINYIEPTCGNGAILKEIVNKRLDAGISKTIIASTTFGYDILPDNIEASRNLLKELLGHEYTQTIEANVFQVECTLKYLKENKGMFQGMDAIVIMNPPYHFKSEAQKLNTAQPNHSCTLYHLFIQSIIDNVNPKYMISIHPNRWMAGGKGLDAFRKTFKADRRIEEIILYMNSKAVFPSVDIAGGIQILKWNKNHNGLCDLHHAN